MPSKKTLLLCFLIFAPVLSLSAHDGGGGYHGGDGGGYHGGDGGGYLNRRNVDPNYYWNGDDGMYYGGVVIDPNAGSGAGMTDDSDQLYDSYLKNFGTFDQ